MITEEIPALLAGERIDRVVALLAEVSRSEAVRLIDAGAVTLAGNAVTAGKQRAATGDVIVIDTSFITMPEPPKGDDSVVFEVLHADEHLIVVDKPAGLVVHPATGNETGTLVNGLLARFPEIASVGEEGRPGIVHRLDGGTSGLLTVARSEAAYAVLTEMLRDHTIQRVYDTLVWGVPAVGTGTIDAPIGRDQRNPLQMAVVGTGKPARTHYKVEFGYDSPSVARLTCELETGRTHQIRVHLAAVGHPVVGDTMYGDRRTTLGLRRPFLHARRLAFAHPITGTSMEFTSPRPDDLQAVLDELARG